MPRKWYFGWLWKKMTDKCNWITKYISLNHNIWRVEINVVLCHYSDLHLSMIQNSTPRLRSIFDFERMHSVGDFINIYISIQNVFRTILFILLNNNIYILCILFFQFMFIYFKRNIRWLLHYWNFKLIRYFIFIAHYFWIYSCY